MLFLYTEMVVVSAPKSISAQPERRSLSVSTAFAVTKGAISWSAISILACWKQCSKFLRTEARATILRKRPSMWLPTRPTGLACRLLPTLYSCGATSNISISTTGMAMFSSPIALTSSSDMIDSVNLLPIAVYDFTIYNLLYRETVYLSSITYQLLSFCTDNLVAEFEIDT